MAGGSDGSRGRRQLFSRVFWGLSRGGHERQTPEADAGASGAPSDAAAGTDGGSGCSSSGDSPPTPMSGSLHHLFDLQSNNNPKPEPTSPMAGQLRRTYGNVDAKRKTNATAADEPRGRWSFQHIKAVLSKNGGKVADVEAPKAQADDLGPPLSYLQLYRWVLAANFREPLTHQDINVLLMPKRVSESTTQCLDLVPPPERVSPFISGNAVKPKTMPCCRVVRAWLPIVHCCKSLACRGANALDCLLIASGTIGAIVAGAAACLLCL